MCPSIATLCGVFKRHLGDATFKCKIDDYLDLDLTTLFEQVDFGLEGSGLRGLIAVPSVSVEIDPPPCFACARAGVQPPQESQNCRNELYQNRFF